MKDKMGLIGRTGLKYFGAMTASISHDIKNVLAIMNENAGLTKDLTLMARKGAPLDLDKVESLATRFEQQIHRADTIVKSLNQFAHSVDAEEKPVEVGEAIPLVLSLATRFIAMKSVTIDFQPSESPCRVVADPFLLNNLLWFCLEYSLKNTGPEKTLSLGCACSGSKVSVTFCGLKELTEASPETPLFAEAGNTLAQHLGAAIKLNPEGRSLELVFDTHL